MIRAERASGGDVVYVHRYGYRNDPDFFPETIVSELRKMLREVGKEIPQAERFYCQNIVSYTTAIAGKYK